MKCNADNFIKQLKKQKEDALDYIIEGYSGLVHAISFKILSDMSHCAVDECVNDVFRACGKMRSSSKAKRKILKNGLPW